MVDTLSTIGDAGCAAGVGDPGRDRRLRHRLLRAVVPQAFPDRHRQARPQLHPRARHRRRGHRDRERRHPALGRARHPDRRRGRRGGSPAPARWSRWAARSSRATSSRGRCRRRTSSPSGRTARRAPIRQLQNRPDLRSPHRSSTSAPPNARSAAGSLRRLVAHSIAFITQALVLAGPAVVRSDGAGHRRGREQDLDPVGGEPVVRDARPALRRLTVAGLDPTRIRRPWSRRRTRAGCSSRPDRSAWAGPASARTADGRGRTRVSLTRPSP